jgi:DNA repair exonuclease SbcCD ATPase subunit
LEHAWSELSEAKRAQQEQRGECDELRKQLGEGASRAMNTESMRREVEQREAVLRATSQQLQDQLQRSMRDAAAREDRLSEELGELRRRWQEAVSSREQLASEIASASAPLLRQIAALQEQLRVKTEQWTQVESALVERAMKSESAAEQFEHRRSLLEEQSQNFHHSLTETQARLANTQKQLVETQAANQQLQRSEARHIEDARDLQARLAQETAQVSSLQVALRDLELRHRLAITETNEAHIDNERKLSAQCEDMQKEIATLRDTLSRYKMSATVATPTASSSAPPLFTNQGSSSSFSEADVADRASVSTVPANGFVASERQHQQRQLREEELAALRSSVLSLTQARDALLEEVSFLSARNAQLEDSTVSLPALRSNAQQLQQQVEVLLVLLGEKEEENDSLAEDLRETKQLYRDQMDSLLSRCLILEAGAVNHKSSDTIDEDTPSNSYRNDSPHKKQITSAVSTPTLSTFQHNNHDCYSSCNYGAATSKRCTNENGKLAVWQSDTNLLELSMSTK